MSLVAGYVAYMAITTIYAIIVAQMALRRAWICDSRFYEISVIFAWYDFWIGAFYDRKQSRVYMLVLPCLGICVDFDANPPEDQ